jgi:two-component system, cell cycle response regulator DivK
MKRVLVVEDNAANLRLVNDILQRAGYAVLTESDAKAGIATARTEQPDLILMDIQLPGMDGLTATGILKGDAATSAIPIIALTAHAMRGDEQRILDAGCDRYISKPIRYKHFLEVVAEILAD